MTNSNTENFNKDVAQSLQSIAYSTFQLASNSEYSATARIEEDLCEINRSLKGIHQCMRQLLEKSE